MDTPSPESHLYTQNASGKVDVSFTVSSPPSVEPGKCDTTLPHTFGNTDSNTIKVTVEITQVIDAETNLDVREDIKDMIVAAFTPPLQSPPLQSPTLDKFDLTNPPSLENGSYLVSFTVTNSSYIPVGDYDINIRVRSTSNGTCVPHVDTMFKLKVTEPTLFDTQEPDLRIDSPTDGSQIVINGTLAVRFTANDPDKDGVGTGVTSVAASIRSSGGAGNENITSYLSVDPSPSLAVPVPAGTDVDAAVDIQMQEVGSYMLIVEATDGADNTATRAVSFTVKATPVWLPPVSMSGRQFKSGSTVPVKWTFTDANEAFLPPYASIKAKISGSTDSGPTAVTAVAGSGASNIRWELDSAGHATQYIVNFPIPATAFGTYTVTIFVEDVDGNEWAEQGTYKFVVSPKGGKM